MHKTSSGLGNGGDESIIKNWREAFRPGEDFQATGDVDHRIRTVSGKLQRAWDDFANDYQTGITNNDIRALMKDYDGYTNQLYGYLRTSNSFAINRLLYNEANAGKSDSQIFTRKDRRGVLRDLQTVQTLDRAIGGHTTKGDGVYTRFCTPDSIQATFKLSDAQMNVLKNARGLNQGQLRKLNAAFSGSTSYSKAYTSTSANRSMNAFGNLKARHSNNYLFERKLYVPKGTNAYAAKTNAQESEVIFGRKMETRLMKVTVASDGHIVLHEMYTGYRKR